MNNEDGDADIEGNEDVNDANDEDDGSGASVDVRDEIIPVNHSNVLFDIYYEQLQVQNTIYNPSPQQMQINVDKYKFMMIYRILKSITIPNGAIVYGPCVMDIYKWLHDEMNTYTIHDIRLIFIIRMSFENFLSNTNATIVKKNKIRINDFKLNEYILNIKSDVGFTNLEWNVKCFFPESLKRAIHPDNITRIQLNEQVFNEDLMIMDTYGIRYMLYPDAEKDIKMKNNIIKGHLSRVKRLIIEDDVFSDETVENRCRTEIIGFLRLGLGWTCPEVSFERVWNDDNLDNCSLCSDAHNNKVYLLKYKCCKQNVCSSCLLKYILNELHSEKFSIVCAYCRGECTTFSHIVL